MAGKTIAAFLIINIEDPAERSRVEIAASRRSADNWHAKKVERGLLQRVDLDRWYIAEEYDDGTTAGEG